MSEKLSKQDRDKWKDRILKLLDIDDSYYKSKYKGLFQISPVTATKISPRKWNIYSDNP